MCTDWINQFSIRVFACSDCLCPLRPELCKPLYDSLCLLRMRSGLTLTLGTLTKSHDVTQEEEEDGHKRWRLQQPGAAWSTASGPKHSSVLRALATAISMRREWRAGTQLRIERLLWVHRETSVWSVNFDRVERGLIWQKIDWQKLNKALSPMIPLSPHS